MDGSGKAEGSFGLNWTGRKPRIPYPENMRSGRAAHRRQCSGELALLKQIRARAARLTPAASTAGCVSGIGDDCALLRVGAGEELAVTTDLSISGRHFRLEWQTPESIGHRTLARGLSDLAAMGARPVAAFLSLGVPKELFKTQKGAKTLDRKVARFFDGFFALARCLSNASGRRRPGGITACRRRHCSRWCSAAWQSPAPLRRAARRLALRHRHARRLGGGTCPACRVGRRSERASRAARGFLPNCRLCLRRIFLRSHASRRDCGWRGAASRRRLSI